MARKFYNPATNLKRPATLYKMGKSDGGIQGELNDILLLFFQIIFYNFAIDG
jgi:hypothetical protein